MSKFLLSVWHDEEYVVDFTTEEMQRIGPQVGAFNEELMASGSWVFGDGLQPASTAIVMRMSADGSVSATDGPYAETKEQIGGFWVLDVGDRDDALEWARKAALAVEGPVELRPFQDG